MSRSAQMGCYILARVMYYGVWRTEVSTSGGTNPKVRGAKSVLLPTSISSTHGLNDEGTQIIEEDIVGTQY